MNFEPKKSKLAELKAYNETMNNIQYKIQDLQNQLLKYNQKQRELAEKLQEENNLPDIPIEKWDFSQVDWLELEGKIKVPDGDG